MFFLKVQCKGQKEQKSVDHQESHGGVESKLTLGHIAQMGCYGAPDKYEDKHSNQQLVVNERGVNEVVVGVGHEGVIDLELRLCPFHVPVVNVCKYDMVDYGTGSQDQNVIFGVDSLIVNCKKIPVFMKHWSVQGHLPV